MPTSPNPSDLVWILVALALGGFSKGLTGMGLPLITVPVLASVFGVERAVLIMVIPSALLNHYTAWTHRDARGEVPELPRLLLGAIPGVAIGASVLQLGSDRWLTTTLAVWLLAYVLLRLVHPRLAVGPATRRRWSPLVGATASALQAATGVSAPIVVPYLDAVGLRPRAYVFALCVCFGVFATWHFVLVAASGTYTPLLLGQSAFAVVPALACIPLGIRARRFISPFWFDWIIRLTLVVMASRLLYDAWLG